MKTSIPNVEQLKAVQRYATYHGRKWKSMLVVDWSKSYYTIPKARKDEGDDCLLQQVRNVCGPQWLRSKLNTVAP